MMTIIFFFALEVIFLLSKIFEHHVMLFFLTKLMSRKKII